LSGIRRESDQQQHRRERVSDLACGSTIEGEKGDERLKRENDGRYFRKIKNKKYYFIYPALL